MQTADLGRAAAIMGACAALLSLGVQGDFVTDDAAISLRYAFQLSHGDGLRWNRGENPVEGFSNLSHVVMGAGALSLGLPALSTLRLINQASLVLLCILVYAMTFQALRSRLWSAAAAVLVGAHAPFAYWASSGLETGVYCLSVYAGIWAYLRPTGPLGRWLALPLLLFAAVTRFDGVVVFFVVLAATMCQSLLLRSPAPLRTHLPWMTAFVVSYGCYFLWRYHYFGHPLPNSAYYKLGAGTGFQLLGEFISETPSLWLLLPLAGYRRLGWLSLVLAGLIAAYVVGYYDKKGSVSYFHRFFLPLVPALAILAASALERLWRLRGGYLPARGLAIVLLIGALASTVMHPRVGMAHVSSSRERLNSRIVSRARAAEHIVGHYAPDRVIAVGDVGTLGYIVPNPVIDTFGLNDERFPHVYKNSRPRYVRAVRDQDPHIVVVVSKDANRLDPRYATDRYLTKGRSFSDRYSHRATIVSPFEPYHYMIYARDDVAENERGGTFRLRQGVDISRMVDDAARRAHSFAEGVTGAVAALVRRQ